MLAIERMFGSVPKLSSGTVTISVLSTVAVWGINFAAERLETTIVNLAIAVLTAIVVRCERIRGSSHCQLGSTGKATGSNFRDSHPFDLSYRTSGIIWGHSRSSSHLLRDRCSRNFDFFLLLVANSKLEIGIFN